MVIFLDGEQIYVQVAIFDNYVTSAMGGYYNIYTSQ